MRNIIPTTDHHGRHCVVTLGKKRVLTIPRFAQVALGIGPGDKLVLTGMLQAHSGDRLHLTVTKGRIELRPVVKVQNRG